MTLTTSESEYVILIKKRLNCFALVNNIIYFTKYHSLSIYITYQYIKLISLISGSISKEMQKFLHTQNYW